MSRGSLGTIISNMFALGSLFTYTTGYFISSWRTVAWLQILPCALFGLSALLVSLPVSMTLSPANCNASSLSQVPNSPYWLVEKGRDAEARASLRVLRGPRYDLEPELAEIVTKKREKEQMGRSVMSTLASRVFLLPFLRIGALMMITQWAGINVITSYMVTIFQESGSSLSPGLAPILVCTVQQGLAMLSTGVLRYPLKHLKSLVHPALSPGCAPGSLSSCSAPP